MPLADSMAWLVCIKRMLKLMVMIRLLIIVLMWLVMVVLEVMVIMAACSTCYDMHHHLAYDLQLLPFLMLLALSIGGYGSDILFLC